MILLVTGGFGFIGKHLIAEALRRGHFVINVDAMNYAADRVVGASFSTFQDYRFINADIAALDYLPECDIIVNFAAESHVDNSITNNTRFCHSNILGTQRLLDLPRNKQVADIPRFIQISTDEVYGDIISGSHKESDPLRPSNPYSATKAAADM